MDSKTSPRHSEKPRKEATLYLLPTKSAGKRNVLSSKTTKLFLGLFLCLVCLCASVLVNFSLLIKYGKLSEELARQGQLLEKVIADQVTHIPQHNLQVQNQNKNPIFIGRRYKRKSPNARNTRAHCGRRCRRRRRHTNNRPNPVTHLTGQFKNVTDIVYHGDYFIWRTPHFVFTTSFRYLSTGTPDSVYGLDVLRSGVYVIYSQMAVHGFSVSVYKSDCAHETVRVRPGPGDEQTQVLLKSLLTQDQRGRGFYYDGGGAEQHPLDTSIQMGIFALKRNDKIFVRRPARCSHVNYQMDHRYTYFGAFMLHPLQ